jgi:NADH-quinone oxidoreductase subunit N
MRTLDFLALLPLLVLSLGAITLMLQIAFQRNPDWSWNIALLTLIATALSCLSAQSHGQVTPLLTADDYSQIFSLIFVSATAVVTLLSKDYLHQPEGSEEYYLLLLLATLGAVVLAHASHLASLLLGLELLGVALYALIAYPDRGKLPLEAAIKYLVLSGAASATLLFGFALLYGATGSLEFATIGQRLSSAAAPGSPIILVTAGVFIFSGLAFKLSVVPFHMWTPDVYQGAPAPISGFLATVSKAAIFVALFRWYLDAGFLNSPPLVSGIAVLAIASMVVGNVLALQQQNIKRLLGYSSIAHMGYLLIVVVAAANGTDRQWLVEAAAYYLVAYMTATLAAFALVGMLQSDSDSGEYERVADLSGLFWRQPLLALLLTLAMLSLAGIPLTAGFIGKFYIVQAGVGSALWGMMAALVVGSGIGIYYYLRIVFAMSQASAEDGVERRITPLSLGRAVIYVLIYLMLYLGIFPQRLMDYLSAIY